MKEQQKESGRGAEGEWQKRWGRVAERECLCAELEQRRGTFVIRLARSRLRVAITAHEEAEKERGGREEAERRERGGREQVGEGKEQ